MNLRRWLQRQKIEWEDWLRYHPVVRASLSRWIRLRSAWSSPRDAQGQARSITALCAAARLTTNPRTIRGLVADVHTRLQGLKAADVNWSEFGIDVKARRLGMAELLKPPDEREKGVLFIAFDTEWLRLLRHCNLDELAARYTLVLAPGWSPPHSLVNFAFAAAFPGPLFTLISHRQDLEWLPQMAPNFVAVPLYASNWVHPVLFRPRPRDQRDIDLIMVANFAKFKRHHALFRALRRMPQPFRLHLIGQDQDGRSADTLQQLARTYGVEGRFTLQSKAPYSVVADTLCRSRASVILSRNEGSCVVVTESFFADTPVALLEGAQIGSTAFINPSTGRFLREADLANELTRFLQDADHFFPRRWAEQNIDCFHSSAALNAFLRQHALQAGQPWTRDIEPLCWRPFPRLASDEARARLRPARRVFEEQFGLAVGPPEPAEYSSPG